MSHTWMIGPELVPALLRAKERYDAGVTSTLEAAIEQMEAMLMSCSDPHLRLLMEAMKAFNEGDDSLLRAMSGGKPITARLRALRRRSRAK